ncbi:hypothetical protein SJI19_09365 [Acerihabitans sp. TG2]|uniref:hypothetical protein n=1 Tax=Acerihabitans sp. TG2 TaxID=3096008 RepID=UPI002B230BAD|nr:hypothetical protein [Acerihabitans sp. TG2]MEA9390747.1 hypothetical protein [Acerihabitans sp. TG2]
MGEFASVANALAVPPRHTLKGSLRIPPNQTLLHPRWGKMLLLAGMLAISACSSHYQGKVCQANVRTLSGQPLGTTQALILDKYTSFQVTLPDKEIDSGTLFTTDRTKYVPSAVTPEGFLAQRLSDNRFSIINAPQDQWVSYTCP